MNVFHRGAVLAFFMIPMSHAEDETVDTAASNQVEYRQVVFSGLGKHMKALSMIVKGEAPDRVEDRQAHVASLVLMADLVPHIFPEGTGPDAVAETEALATIWSDAEGFGEATATFQEKVAALSAVSGADMDVFVPAFGQVGRSCGGCHDSYRKDD